MHIYELLSSSVALHRAIYELSYQENEKNKQKRRYTVSSVHSDVTATGKKKKREKAGKRLLYLLES